MNKSRDSILFSGSQVSARSALSDRPEVLRLLGRHSPCVPSPERLLEDACLKAAAKSSRTNLDLRFSLLVEGALPAEDRENVLAAVAVMVGNAIEHGFYGYSRGEIDIRLFSGRAIDTRLEVADNGWGFNAGVRDVAAGRGLQLLCSLGEVFSTSEQIAPGRRLNQVCLLISRFQPVDTGCPTNNPFEE